MTIRPDPCHGFRYLREVIPHAVCLQHCFSPSLRDIALIMAARRAATAARLSGSSGFSASLVGRINAASCSDGVRIGGQGLTCEPTDPPDQDAPPA